MNIRFESCEFQNCAVVGTFVDCKFENCRFERISVSTRLTVFRRTWLPATDFLDAVVSLPRPSEDSQESKSRDEYAKVRREKTKSKIAYFLLRNALHIGEDSLVTEATRARLLTVPTWKLLEAKHGILGRRVGSKGFESASWLDRGLSVLRLAFSFGEFGLMKLVGAISGWGTSLTRVVLFGLVLVVSFGFFYSVFGHQPLIAGISRSFDISSLAGYSIVATGKAPGVALTTGMSWIFRAQLVFSIIWYAVLTFVLVRRLPSDA